MTKWHDMAVAPRSEVVDGVTKAKFILGYCPDEAITPEACVEVIWWEPLAEKGAWYGTFGEEMKPTKWAPMPAVDAEPAIGGWQPIATAPKDGTFVDLWEPERCDEILEARWTRQPCEFCHDDVMYHEYCWIFVFGTKNNTIFVPNSAVSHWRPTALITMDQAEDEAQRQARVFWGF
jgi:hypothetical protein